MQRAEHQVAGFGRRQREADRFEVAHLADQDDVRVFAQSRSAAHSANDSVCGADFALVDQALLGLVHELDRIFDRDDVAGLGCR